jgi:murein DD-endopeptidase MepM/ murein hydrolase activator NlpD
LRRARFEDPTKSLYLLPFPVGARYKVTQTYCFPGGGHHNQLAYDFNVPIGADVVASRSGTVINLREDSPDDGRGDGEHNFVFIQHEDGTVAFYAHLKHEGALVGVGDEVVAGQRIALSGNSGLTGSPHLHFGVYRSSLLQEGHDVPVNFRNTSYPLDAWGGLRQGGVYLAEEDPGLPS